MTVRRFWVTGADDVRLAVEADDGQGPTVVFVHGSNGGLVSWSAVVERLHGVRAVRYARRHHPPSSAAVSPTTFEAEARDLLAVVGSVGPAHVVAGSYGAVVALHAALADKAGADAGIRSLALFEPPLLLVGPHLRAIRDRARALYTDGRHAELLASFLRDVAQVPDAVVEASPAPPDDPQASRSALSDLEAMACDTIPATTWASVAVPVLLMGGGRTWSPIPEGLDALVDALSDVRRVVWPEQSHFATATAPGLVADAVRAFIDDLPDRPAPTAG